MARKQTAAPELQKLLVLEPAAPKAAKKPSRKEANPATPQSEAPLTENTAQANRERVARSREAEKAQRKAEIAAAPAPRLRVVTKRAKNIGEANKIKKAMIAEGRVVTMFHEGKKVEGGEAPKGAMLVKGRLPNSGPKIDTRTLKEKVDAGDVKPAEVKKSRQGLQKANGFTRPKGGKTGRVWDLADANPEMSRADLVALAVAEGLNKNMAMTQYGRWRKFVGR